MNRKQLLPLLVVAALVGGAALVALQRNRVSWNNAAPSRILSFDLNGVEQLSVRQKDSELNLLKKDGIWTVKERTDYPADFDRISELIRKLWELKPVQTLKVGPSQLGLLQLVAPGKAQDDAGLQIDLKDSAGKSLGSLLVGKQFMRNSQDMPADMPGFPVGRYVMASNGGVSLINDPLEEIQVKPENWLNPAFLNIKRISSINVSGASGSTWKIRRETETADWQLEAAAPGETLDTAQTSVFNMLLANATFADVLAPDAKPESVGLDKPLTVEIETLDNFLYKLSIGKEEAGRYAMKVSVTANLQMERTPGKDEKPEDKSRLDEAFKTQLESLKTQLEQEKRLEQRIYLVSKETLAALFKERKSLLKAAEPAASASPAPSPAAPASATSGSSQTVTTQPVSAPAPNKPQKKGGKSAR